MLRPVVIAATVGVLVVPAAAQAPPGMLSIKGTFSYVVVKDRGGDVVIRRRPAKHRVRILRHVPAGVYRLTARRSRSASCSRRLHVFSRGLTDVTVGGAARRRCTIERRAFPARFPSLRRIRAVQRFLRTRQGLNSWSLVDSWGRLHGFAPHRVYVSASLVKAMLLTAYLRGIGNRMPDDSARDVLWPMITWSSNDAADTMYSELGDAALYRVAKAAGMRTFSVAGYWANAHFSAEDQARFFNRIDRLIPKRSRAYARTLLSSIVPEQRWGFSPFAAAAGFKTFFKGGWRGTDIGQLVHEAALFERGDTRISMAVLTDGNPSHEYGTETLRGVAERLFGRPAKQGAATASAAAAAPAEHAGAAPVLVAAGDPALDPPLLGGTRATRRAGLVDVHRYGPGIRVKLSYRSKHNETGKPLPGYCENWALLHRPGAFSLGQVQRYLRRQGLGLLVLDAYRPVRATEALVRWAERTGRGGAVGTYIARRSRHNTGSAVDITLVRDGDGKRLRMGGFAFRPSSHTYNASGRILRNRLTLKNAMERFGFTAYLNEWWHFEHRVRPNRYLDVTLGCARHN